MDLGATVIDMGGGTTAIAVFRGGRLVFADAVPVGGNHVTNDIALGLSTPRSHAERMKTLYGSTLPGATDEKDIMEVPSIGEEDAANATHVPRSALTGIIRPRVEETLELVRDRLETRGGAERGGQRVVLTGGASQLQGMREMTARILDKQVRIGRPLRIAGLAEAAAGPGFSACGRPAALRRAQSPRGGERRHARRHERSTRPRRAMVEGELLMPGRVARARRARKSAFRRQITGKGRGRPRRPLESV